MIAGTLGWSLMQIEHAIPQSKSRSKKNRYNNCFLVCERCNKAHRDRPNTDESGNRLLNPCKDQWSEHFDRVGDEIHPRKGDASAEYTWEVYDLDDPSKVILRAQRRRWIENSADSLVDLKDLEEDLMDRVVEDSDVVEEERLKAVEQAQRLYRLRMRFLEKLAGYNPVPPGADTSCSCGRPLAIPKVLADQTVDLDDLLRQARERREQANSGKVS